MRKLLTIVCDDAGFDSVDRGIDVLTDATGKPVSAEYMIEQPGAVDLARRMMSNRLVSIGLHFELFDMSDADRVALSVSLKQRSDATLGEQRTIQEMAIRDARRQLKIFRSELKRDPKHGSTHGNFNVDRNGQIMEWWTDEMNEQFDGRPPLMQLGIPHVRHNKYSWNLPGIQRPPLTPDEFQRVLEEQKDAHHVEFVLHPAAPEKGDRPLNMLFDAEMRKRDLISAIEIIRSGAIEAAGYEIVSVEDMARDR